MKYNGVTYLSREELIKAICEHLREIGRIR